MDIKVRKLSGNVSLNLDPDCVLANNSMLNESAICNELSLPMFELTESEGELKNRLAVRYHNFSKALQSANI